MIGLCLTAGLNIFVSLERVVKELYYSFPDLAFELDIVRRQAELRSFEPQLLWRALPRARAQTSSGCSSCSSAGLAARESITSTTHGRAPQASGSRSP